MSSDSDNEFETYTESDIDSDATGDYQRAFYTLVERFLYRVTSYMMSNEIWADIPNMIATYSWLEHNPILRSGANYENINKLKELAGDVNAPVHARRFAISYLTPGDVLSLLPVILDSDEKINHMFNGFEGHLSRTQVRALYYFISMPLLVKKSFLHLPDMYRVCHEIVEEAVSNKTAVSMLKANSVPYYMQPTLPMTMRGKLKKHKGGPPCHMKWKKTRADTLDEY